MEKLQTNFWTYEQHLNFHGLAIRHATLAPWFKKFDKELDHQNSEAMSDFLNVMLELEKELIVAAKKVGRLDEVKNEMIFFDHVSKSLEKLTINE
jgi:hypothetical protein